MNWKFSANFFGPGKEQNQVQHIPTQSCYPPLVVGSSPGTFHPSTPSGSSSIIAHQKSSDQTLSFGQPSPSEAAGIIATLKDKGYIAVSIGELRKILTDKDAYNSFFHSLEQVKVQNHLCVELRKETLQLARENLYKEPQILELKNQCQIIRSSKLAAALEKLNELDKQKEEILKFYSLPMLLQKLHDATNEADEDSDTLCGLLLQGEVDLSAFVQRYKKLRTVYHRSALIHLAVRDSGV